MKRLVVLIVLGSLLVIAAYFLQQDSPRPKQADTRQTGAGVDRQEELFRECVAARDHEIHRKTFATIDNPDVQREILATEKERAVRECREKYPDL
ncbi:MAG: hypothetical protein L0Y45_04930 [Woeseiaceae bacterium]|nr:hypothetical protein [Woeseiaceae bacterium]